MRLVAWGEEVAVRVRVHARSSARRMFIVVRVSRVELWGGVSIRRGAAHAWTLNRTAWG